MADDPQKIADQIQQQNDDNYRDDNPLSGGGAEPMIIDEAIEEVTGEEPRLKQSVNIAREIDEDEEALDDNPPPGADTPEEDEADDEQDSE